MAIKVQGQTVVDDDRKGSFQVSNPGQFTTAERDALTPEVGDNIFNTDDGELQIWDGTEWGSAGGAVDLTTNPVFNNLTLSEDPPGTGRFTNQDFKLNFDMAADGVPASIKGIKGNVTAQFDSFPTTSASSAVTKSDLYTNPTAVNSSPPFGSQWSSLWAPADVYDRWSSNSPKFMLFSLDQYYTRWAYVDPDTFAVTQFNTPSGTGASGYDLSRSVVTCKGRYVTAYKMSDLNAVTFDLQQLFTTGDPAKQIGASYAETDNYRYKCTGSTLYRYDLVTGEQLGSAYFNDSTLNKGILFELNSTTIAIAGTYGGANTQKVYMLTDDLPFNNQQISGVQTWGVQNPGYYRFVHEGKMYMVQNYNLYSVDENYNTTTTVLPDSHYNEPVTVNKLTGEFTLMASLAETISTNNYRFYIQKYTSNNYGTSWVKQAETTYDYSSGSYQNSPSIGTTLYMPKGEAFWQDKYYNREPRVMAVDGYYQDVTVPNDADIGDFTINTYARPDSWSALRPEGLGFVTSVSSGATTTTLRIYGGATYNVGDAVTLTASTGQSQAVKYLVLDTTGKVTDLASSDPGYVDVGSALVNTINFPALLPTGNSPDEELPAGTVLQTFGRAANEKGTVERVSNSIIPGSAKLVFGLTGFQINNASGDANYQIYWKSDTGGDLSNTPDNQADAIWRSQSYYQNKAIQNSSFYEGFSNYFLLESASSRNNVSFTFKGDDLQGKILEFGVYGAHPSAQEIYSEMTTSTPGVSIYALGTAEWTSGVTGLKKQSLIINDAGVTQIDVNFEYQTVGQVQTDTDWLSIVYWRLQDLEGNDLVTEPFTS